MRHTKHNLKKQLHAIRKGHDSCPRQEAWAGIPRNVYILLQNVTPDLLFVKEKNETINAGISGYFHENNYIFVSVQFLHLQLLIY